MGNHYHHDHDYGKSNCTMIMIIFELEWPWFLKHVKRSKSRSVTFWVAGNLYVIHIFCSNTLICILHNRICGRVGFLLSQESSFLFFFSVFYFVLFATSYFLHNNGYFWSPWWANGPKDSEKLFESAPIHDWLKLKSVQFLNNAESNCIFMLQFCATKYFLTFFVISISDISFRW